MQRDSIQVDIELARSYNSIPPEEQLRLQEVMALWIKCIKTDGDVLGALMDYASAEAQQSGLTPEILQDILADDE